MALSDRIQSPERNLHGMPCSVGVLLDTLQGGELTALEHILASREWSQAMVWKALTDEGYEVGLQSVNRHRGGKCRCAKARADRERRDLMTCPDCRWPIDNPAHELGCRGAK